LNTLNRWFSRFEEWSSGSLLVIGLGLILYGVFMRYVVNLPQAWVEEVSKYLVVWGVLMGGSLALRNKHHITVDLLYLKFNGLMQKVVNIFANLVGVLFTVIYGSYGVQLVLKKVQTGQVSLDVGIPLWIVYLILPISAVMLGLRFLEKTYKAILSEPVQERGDQDDLASF
jgi:C4-dicarboxylate transporter DctQ subunit